jgi:hypothetical protein
MRVGDLVEYSDTPEEAQGRICGIVTGVDKYTPRSKGYSTEPIVEVLWNNGINWILQARVTIVDTYVQNPPT